ncbi:MAG TPA: DNA polymerase/3'-5' exonuclease PolX [Candidatus Omnitrophica bacterium]|nr:MAG: DNA polymerase/3'-5' exonuclease PolX [Candidatus Omnitrophota bacterium]RKY43394.1 MAG: DNA polymerase/3'-5' exonuclease PolX [Candidatus Omnitrophota bacterium]HEC69003.1 DNA polymerase/3'-5' exonuclease PolX [Candidatus Omnitrophota bacterium]
MENQDIAKVFREIAIILELKGDNPFRIRAYQKAAQNIESLPFSLKDPLREGRLEEIPGIGKDLAEKIKEIITTGKLRQHQTLKKSVPSGLIEMLSIPGLGPKTVKVIYEKLKISDIKSLEKAALAGRLKGLPGIKEKTEENILKGIALIKGGRERMPLYQALKVAESFVEPLKKLKEVEKIEPAGSLRRRKETIKDIDILVVSSKPSKVMDNFVNLPNVKEVLAKGETKSSVISRQNIQVDLRVVENASFGSALMYFTGSKNFNISLRTYALKKNYKINEYGVFKIEKNREKRVAGETEEEIFKLFGMDYILPTLREDRGEIELALKGRLPKVVELKDIKGDLHVHSKYSDGAASLTELSCQAQEKGYKYLGVCDHSQSLKVAKGLDIKTLFKKIEEVRRLNKKFKDFYLLTGAEVDILSDGSLDYPDEVLKELDLVIAAIHTGFKQSKSQLTRRILSAIKNRYVHIIAHPTGRLFGVRDSYQIDLDEILSACSDYNVALEINAYPQRLDLNDINCKKAKEKKVKLAIGTDAHIIEQLSAVELGVWIAQRGWLEKEDLLNSLDLQRLLKWLRSKK